jgi:D-alanyl-D-alanine-carboxypeptidase/D-alanyl-D-alanine-endopeptidase
MQRLPRRSFLGGAFALAAIGIRVRAATPSEGQVAEVLRRRVDLEKRSVGMAAVVVTGSEQTIACHGRVSSASDRLVSRDTIFELGSITKVFTALLLAELAREGVLAVNDPAARHLPADFTLPELNGRAITLADLAMHTAGLPRFPPMGGAGLASVSSYTTAQFRDWLATLQLSRVPGQEWEYSNAGYALLGLALSHRTKEPFGNLLTHVILQPLRMGSTFLEVPPEMKARLAVGHDAALNPGPPLELGIFAPAGSLRSTAPDMARFMRAVRPGSGSSLEAAARRLLESLWPAPSTGGQQALGWEVLPAAEGPYVSKDGVTANQCATAVMDLTGETGVVVFSNTFPDLRNSSPSGGGRGAADVARHLLRPSIALRN